MKIFERIKNMLYEKDDKKKMDNLIAFLIILVVTLILINKILGDDNKNEDIDVSQSSGVELVSQKEEDTVLVSNVKDEDEMAQNLEEILSKISGVGKVDVLITYSESSSIYPLYNESVSSSTSTDSGGVTTETKTESKDVFTVSSRE